MVDSNLKFEPAYLKLHRSGELQLRAEKAREHMKVCDLCARLCHVNRLEGQTGAACETGERAYVHSFAPHFGEEDPLRGIRGSGTVFFSCCSMRCVYCQNSDVSWEKKGKETTPAELADIFLSLQEQGCHNINFVSPSHVVAQILEALVIAVDKGLCIPLVYNTGGYDSPEALRLLDGIIDIYMPDMKYGDDEKGRRLSKVRNYVSVNKTAVKEMHRQVGDLVMDENGIAQRGLLVRHLVLPSNLSDTEEVLKFLAEEISTETYCNLMAQYRPRHKAMEDPELCKRPTIFDFRRVEEIAVKYGITRLDERAPAWMAI